MTTFTPSMQVFGRLPLARRSFTSPHLRHPTRWSRRYRRYLESSVIRNQGILPPQPFILANPLLKSISSPRKVKPEPETEDAEASHLPLLSQDSRARRSRSAAPATSKREATPGLSLAASTRASSMPLQADPTRLGSLAAAGSLSRPPGSVSRAGSFGPPRVIPTDTTQRLRPAVGASRVQFSSGTPSSASRAGTPRLPPQPEDFEEPPVLAPPSGRLTRSLSRTIESPKAKPASQSRDPSLVGINAPVPMDPNVRSFISF